MTGGLSGVVTKPGFTQAVVVATDAKSGDTATEVLAINAVEPLSLSGGSAPTTAAITSSYSASFQIQGGTQPYEISSGTLPPGLSFVTEPAGGKISGFPTEKGAFSIVVNAQDSAGQAAFYEYVLTVGR